MISEFKNKDRINTNLLVKNVVNGVTSKGSKYLSITLQDKSGTIEGKYWDVSDSQSELIKAGHVYQFQAEVLEYNKALQLRVNKAIAIEENRRCDSFNNQS